MNSSNRRAKTILFLTMFIVMVGFGVILPILPFYAERMGATATDLGLLFAAYSVVQFFFAPMWGQASDRFGRKPILLVGLSGFGISFIFFGLATAFWMLFAARTLGGILSAATLPTVLAYVADTTDERSRGGGMGAIGAAMGIGISFGPVIGGYLGEISATLPFFFSGTLALLVCVFAYFLLPESRTREAQLQSRQSPRNRNNMGEIWSALFGPIGFILLLAFLASFASSNLEGTFALFSEVHLGFGEAEMGTLFGVMGLVMALSQLFLVGPFITRWGEECMIQIGLVSSALAFALFLVAFNLPSMAAAMAIMGLGNAALRPAVNSLASKRSPAEKQGSAMGVVSSYNSLGRIFGPIAGGLLFDLLGYRWPYIVGGLLFLSIYLLATFNFLRLNGVIRRRLVPGPGKARWRLGR